MLTAVPNIICLFLLVFLYKVIRPRVKLLKILFTLLLTVVLG